MASHLATMVALAIAATGPGAATTHSAWSRASRPFCSIAPPPALAIVRVDRDTTLALSAPARWPASRSDVDADPRDSMLATPGTGMPGARVRLLRVDATTRTALAAAGIRDSQPEAFLLAAPYRWDCRTIRWSDTAAFVVRGEVGYVRAMLAPRAEWIGGVPLLFVSQPWSYPYPRRRGIAFGASPGAPLTSMEAYFTLESVIEATSERLMSSETRAGAERERRDAVMTWARANLAAAELEPARSVVRSYVLAPDFERMRQVPSRLRGSYRVIITSAARSERFFFRTEERPVAARTEPGQQVSIAALLSSPYLERVQLRGSAAPAFNRLPASASDEGVGRVIWLTSTDRPTAPGNEARRTVPGFLEVSRQSVPASLRSTLELFVPPMSASDSTLFARLPARTSLPFERQARLPITLHLDAKRGVHADTTLTRGDHTIRVVLERLDTVSIGRWRY